MFSKFDIVESRHIQTIRLTNFKRFENLEVKELGQFNLIVGDNNVGKTSLLEACLVNDDLQTTLSRFTDLLRSKKFKENLHYGDLNFFRNVSRFKSEDGVVVEISEEGSIKSFYFRFEDIINKFQLEFDINHSQTERFIVNEHYYSILNFSKKDKPLISISEGHDFDFASYYSPIQQNKKLKTALIENLKCIIPDIENIELTVHTGEKQSFLIVSTKTKDETLPLAFYGDGTLKLFRILSKITRFAGQRLMIDEIDAGIHYTRYKTFWKVILKAAKDNNVQLFMTTHNEECIKYYREAIEELKFEADARVVALAENVKTKEVYSTTFNFKQFEEVVDAGNDIR
jgi:AAA15 family ATPase/GTPase